jgi:hypothetical protein
MADKSLAALQFARPASTRQSTAQQRQRQSEKARNYLRREEEWDRSCRESYLEVRQMVVVNLLNLPKVEFEVHQAEATPKKAGWPR